MRVLPLAVVLTLLAPAWLVRAASGSAAAEHSEITLTLDVVDTVRAPAKEPGLGYLAGRAIAYQGELELFDVVFVIDVSGSTAESSGLERDGWLARLPGLPTDVRDSVLGAEVAAIESLLDGFDARTTRVGLVSFSGGENPREPAAFVEAALTSDYRVIREALEQILLAGSNGGTNLRAGLLRAGIEVLGTRSSESTRRAVAVRHLVVLTDGLPTLPARTPELGAIRAARTLADKGVRVHVFEIGRSGGSRAAVEVARVTHGEHHKVRDLANLGRLLRQIELHSLRELRIANLSTGAPALELTKEPDGSYSALVPFAVGVNRIEVVAVASDGRELRVEREVVFGDRELDATQRSRRDRLIELHARPDVAAKPGAAKTERKLEVDVEKPQP